MLITLFTLLAGAHSIEIPFEYVHGHLILEAKVNGKPQRLALDSAVAGQLHLDSGLAKELSLPKIGSTESSDGTSHNKTMVDQVKVDRISIGPIEIRDVEAVSRNLKQELGTNAAFDGVLGAKVFKEFLLTIDYSSSKIKLTKGSLPTPDGKTILPLGEADGIYTISLNLGGKPLEAHLDTGSPMGLIMPLRESKKLQLDSEPKLVGKAKTLHNTIEVYQAMLKGEISLGSHKLERNITFFDKFETANLGNGVLRQFEVTLDLAQKRVQLKKA
jgi:hypothetical protein